MLDLGQLIITGISGLALTVEEKEFIESESIGGVILFSHNFDDPAQLAELVNSIQVLRKNYPLFISVDHEGGRVIRFKKHFTQFPAMYNISSLDSPKLCYQIHAIMAEELSACGVNLNFSPCCDIFNNPLNKVIGDRSFGVDEKTVSKFISSAIRGLQTEGILACAKHFPGHGGTEIDSHDSLPVLKRDLKELNQQELKPFIKAAKSRVELIMMSHIIVEAIDTKRPCSLSDKCYRYLRDSLKYDNLIITDDMQMGAIINDYSIEESAVLAIKAGADIVMYRDFNNSKKALSAIQKAVKTKEINNAVIKEKISRINKCKKENLSAFKPIYIPDVAKKINKKSTQSLLEDINKLLN